MYELENLRQEVELLKQRIKYLEDTLATIADRQYIEQSKRVVAMSKLISEVSDGITVKNSVQQEIAKKQEEEKVVFENEISEKLNCSNQDLLVAKDLEENFKYCNAHGGIEIQSVSKAESEKIFVVPEKIAGRTVVGIAKNAFCNMEFQNVRLPNSIRYIGDRAFYGCRNLETINLPNAIERIGSSCFSGTALTVAIMPESLKEIEPMCFSYCRQLNRIFLNNNLEIIRNAAFQWTDVRKVVIPQNVQMIEKGAFNGFSSTMEIAFLGEETRMEMHEYHLSMMLVYCPSDSEAQKEAQLEKVQYKPLGAFDFD